MAYGLYLQQTLSSHLLIFLDGGSLNYKEHKRRVCVPRGFILRPAAHKNRGSLS